MWSHRQRARDIHRVLIIPHATYELGSWAKHASRTASETKSHNLSGCPSFTDSELNKNSSLANSNALWLEAVGCDCSFESWDINWWTQRDDRWRESGNWRLHWDTERGKRRSRDRRTDSWLSWFVSFWMRCIVMDRKDGSKLKTVNNGKFLDLNWYLMISLPYTSLLRSQGAAWWTWRMWCLVVEQSVVFDIVAAHNTRPNGTPSVKCSSIMIYSSRITA